MHILSHSAVFVKTIKAQNWDGENTFFCHGQAMIATVLLGQLRSLAEQMSFTETALPFDSSLLDYFLIWYRLISNWEKAAEVFRDENKRSSSSIISGKTKATSC